jgi:hypothetical protein
MSISSYRVTIYESLSAIRRYTISFSKQLATSDVQPV